MNKKEVLEIKKQLNPIRCCLTSIAGCYVNSEREIISTFHKRFLALEEEEMLKFFQLFQKTLSGTIGKQLLTLDYKAPCEEQEQLLTLLKSRLEPGEALDRFYRKVADSYQGDGNYYIVLVHGAYDIPGKASDGMELEDASEEVYDHLLGMVCPVSLDKPSLVYNTETQDVENKERAWVLGNPACGFLYPAFTGRTADVNSLLYYSRRPDVLEADLIREAFGTGCPDTASKQKDAFLAAADASGLTYDNAVALKEELALKELDGEDLTLDRPEREGLCRKFGIRMEELEGAMEKGQVSSLFAPNLFDKNKTVISTDHVDIRISADLAGLVEIRNVDGGDCLVIRPDGRIKFDGIPVTAGKAVSK